MYRKCESKKCTEFEQDSDKEREWLEMAMKRPGQIGNHTGQKT